MNLLRTIVESTSGGVWRPGIGDPSWTGWLIVAAYAIAALLSWLAFRASRAEAVRLARLRPQEAEGERRLAWFWLLACVTLTALGINKQLDLQSLFTQVLRDVSHAQGWYDDRRRYQFLFVAAVGSAGLLGVLTMGWRLRRVLLRVWIAVLGLGWITTFVVIRAASFHHVDTFLRSITHAGNVGFELSGIAMVAAGAGRALRSCAQHRVRRHPAVTTPTPSAADETP